MVVGVVVVVVVVGGGALIILATLILVGLMCMLTWKVNPSARSFRRRIFWFRGRRGSQRDQDLPAAQQIVGNSQQKYSSTVMSTQLPESAQLCLVTVEKSCVKTKEHWNVFFLI